MALWADDGVHRMHSVPVFVVAEASEDDGRIQGEVTDASGQPLKGIRISVERIDASSDHRPRVVYSNDEGTFTVVQLRRAEYVVQASAPGLLTWRQERVQVDGIAPQHLYPTLEPDGTEAPLDEEAAPLEEEEAEEEELIHFRCGTVFTP